MKSVIATFVIAVIFGFLSFANAGFAAVHDDIENPSAKLLKKEAEILRRVVKLNDETSLCTGVWMEEGIIATANHCNELTDTKPLIAINGVMTELVTKVLYTNEKPRAVDELLKQLGMFNYRATPIDVTLWLVDPAPLAGLNLPKESLPLAAVESGVTPAGVKMLIAGYGPSSTQTDGQSPLGAAMVETSEVEAGSAFSLQASASRRVDAETSCKAGQKLIRCPHKLHFYSDRKNDDPSTRPGDSGGPALVKNADGVWSLKGILSGGGFTPIDRRSVVMEYSYGGRRSQKVVASLPKRTTIEAEDFGDHLIGREASLIGQILNLDPNQPLPASLEITHKISGLVTDYWVNLSDPEIRKGIKAGIEDLQIRLREFKKEPKSI